MRSEFFQQIRENKERFYYELHQKNSGPLKDPSTFTKSSKISPVELQGKKAILEKIKSFTERLFSRMQTFPKIRQIPSIPGINKIKLPAIKFKIFTRLTQYVSRQYQQMHNSISSKLERLADQSFYFILVFFGEENAMQLAEPGIKVTYRKIRNYFTTQSLPVLIQYHKYGIPLSGKLAKENAKRFNNIINPFKNIMKIQSINLNKHHKENKNNMLCFIKSNFNRFSGVLVSQLKRLVMRL